MFHCYSHFVFFYLNFRHMKEISELQAHQRGEIELLYRRLGKAPPPGLSLTSTVPSAGRRHRASKHKLRASKLLSPLVQQIRSVTKTSDNSKPGDAPFLPFIIVLGQNFNPANSRPVQESEPADQLFLWMNITNNNDCCTFLAFLWIMWWVIWVVVVMVG